MTEKKSIPVWFWIIAIVCLIWNLMGVLAFVGQVSMTPEMIEALPEEQRTMYAPTPAWYKIAFALAVFGATLGCIALLIRKSWAIPLFVISLLGIIAQMYYSFFVSKSLDVYGPGEIIMTVMIIGIGIFLIWFAKMAKSKGWIS